MTESPIKVTYLLAVWGESYIRQFMDLSLRSLLAPGNIPGLGKCTESTFVFLTHKLDRKNFAKHPMFRRLESACRVEFVTIDDLIFNGNYSATLTLAYERGMRHAGEHMLSTYFIYLVADYIMADGSLMNLLPHMQNNVSGITAGNFQVVEENMLDTFKTRINPATGVIAVPPRELVGMSLRHLHPLTVANIVNQNFSHTEHTNRLFWRVDADTLVGRFYLRHMLCIKPEVDDYVIGASCDYSFITEMCPSGNVAHIADSDEYCVIEMQPFAHEQNFVKSGAFRPEKMVQSLGEWTTRTHRDNAFYPVIYHAGEISDAAKEAVDTSLAFVEKLGRKLPEKVQPLRQHPYWISCIEGILEALNTLSDQTDYFRRGVFAGIIGSPVFEPPLGNASGDYNLLRTNRYRYASDWRSAFMEAVRTMTDNEVTYKPWHPEYANSRAIRKKLKRVAAESAAPFLCIAFEATSYAQWCHNQFGSRVALQKYELFDLRSVETIKAYAPDAHHAVILLPITHLHHLDGALTKCAACLSGERKVSVIVMQRYFSRHDRPFKERISLLAAAFDSANAKVESFTSVTGGQRKWLDSFYRRQINILIQRSISPRALLQRILPVIRVALLHGLYTISNLVSRRRKYPRLGDATCAIIELTLSREAHRVLRCDQRKSEVSDE
ncbi:MAG: hypothetical protein SFX19_07145 [Alphaproteobacteria bacterium]|nr:hypothetical protein [Alphaproteobacteria bacterium]